jgi:DNA-binding MarR family transcriptional regulator
MEKAEKKIKGPRKLERHFKGVANHRRIQILLLITANRDITVFEIADAIKCNFKTTSEHVRRLALAGLIEKKHRGREVTHTLTPYGRTFYDFIETFSNS